MRARQKKRPSVETESRLTIACHMKNLRKVVFWVIPGLQSGRWLNTIKIVPKPGIESQEFVKTTLTKNLVVTDDEKE